MKRRFNGWHGLSYTPEYRAWQMMRLRCLEPTNAAYPGYGGRGIKVCERWLNSVEAFVADMGPKPSPAHELDRENNDGHYEPGNCRWVTRKVNDRNRRSNRRVEYNGETKALAEWCEQLDLPVSTIRCRLAIGWTAEEAFTIPIRAKLPKGQRRIYTRPCSDCGTQANGERCRPCENRSRHRDATTGQFDREAA